MTLSHYDETGQALLVGLVEEESNSVLRQMNENASTNKNNTSTSETTKITTTREERLGEIYRMFQNAHEELRLALTILDSVSDAKYGPIRNVGPFMGEEMVKEYCNVAGDNNALLGQRNKRNTYKVEDRLLAEAERLKNGISEDYSFLKEKVLPAYMEGFTRIQREHPRNASSVESIVCLPEYMVDCGVGQLIVPLLPFEGLENGVSLIENSYSNEDPMLFLTINGTNIKTIYSDIESTTTPLFIAHLSRLSEHLFNKVVRGIKEYKKCPYEMINPFHLRYKDINVITLISTHDDDDCQNTIKNNINDKDINYGKRSIIRLINAFLRKENNLFISIFECQQ